MKTAIKTIVVLFLLAGTSVLRSCIRETRIGPEPIGDGSEIMFRLSVPTAARAKTRALDYADEYAVESIDLLVFRAGKYAYTSHGIIVSAPSAPNNTTSAVMTFRTSLIIDPAPCDLMVVANARDIIADAYPDGIAKQTPQSEIEQKLLVAMPAGGWVDDTSQAGYRSIPMWGIAKNQTVSESYAAPASISLTRMVARVDVMLDGALVDAADVSQSKFQLRSVRVYNYATRGRLIPRTDGTNWQTTPSLPPFETSYYDDIQSDGAGQSILRTVARTPENPYRHLTGQIYLFEAPKGVAPASLSGGYMQNPCIVVGGVYRGDSAPTYYRIDFAQRNPETGAVTWLDILRNNSYSFTITDVTGSGFPTEDEAYNSVPANMESVVLVWSNNAINTTVTDGVYMLGLSQREYEFDGDGRDGESTDNRLTVVTNHYDGWKATVWADEAGTVPFDGDWLGLSQSSGTGNYDAGDPIHLNVAALDDSGPRRTAWVHIRAGSFKMVVRVMQEPRFIRIYDESDAEITGGELTFDSKNTLIDIAPPDRKLTIRWSPADRPLTITKTFGDDALIWQNASNGLTEIPVGGSYTPFTVDPAGITDAEVALNPFISKETGLTFSIDGIDGLAAGVDLRQTHYNMVVEGLASGIGKAHSLVVVRSNADWRLELDDPDVVVNSMIPLTGEADTHGNSYLCVLNGRTGEAVFRFSNADELFDRVEKTIESSSAAHLFARSNVVMLRTADNGDILTFAETAADNNTTKTIVAQSGATYTITGGIPANAQGMHFMWGSLVGITSQDVAFSSGQVRFCPTEYSAPGTWAYPKNNNSGQWIPGNIPYMTNVPPSVRGLDQYAFTEQYEGIGYDAAAGKGDICRYISDKGWVEGRWRMPTSGELRALYAETNGKDVVYGVNAIGGGAGAVTIGPPTTNSSGTKWGFFGLGGMLLGAGVVETDPENPNKTVPGNDRVLLPASGYRMYDGGSLSLPGQGGYYWSSTINTETTAYSVSISAIGKNSSRSQNQTYGFTVRCIQNYNDR